MRAIRLENARVGDVLGKSLFNERSELMLAAGYLLTSEVLALLKKHGFRQLYIRDKNIPDFKPLEAIGDAVRGTVARRLHGAFGRIEEELAKLPASPIQLKKRLTEDPNFKRIVPMSEVGLSVNSLLEEILENNISILSSMPVKSLSGHHWQHAIDVAILSVLIGQKFNYEFRELKALGTSALLHDIGKLALGSLSAKPPASFTHQEKWLMQEHPTYSMLILKGSDPHTYIEQTSVLQHHEQPDGKGYPQGLRGLNVAPLKGRANEQGYIFRHAEILACANTYDNLLAGELDGRAHSPQSAVSEMVRQAGMAYNPHVLRALVGVVQFYPTGSVVRVMNTYSGDYIGFRGVVKQENPVDYAKPLVVLTHDDNGRPIEPEPVDFSEERAVYLEMLF